jgi:hypothetical protein
MWRISSLTLFGVTFLFWVFETMASWKRLERWTWLYLRLVKPKELVAFEKRKKERRKTKL